MNFQLKPRVLTEDQIAKLTTDVSKQEIRTRQPRSLDEKNFPVFQPAPAGKYLIYVPNHQVEGELVMDRPIHYTVKPREGTFIKIRSAQGIVNEALGFDGTCPIQDAVGLTFTLANAEIDHKCKIANLNPQEKEDSTVKTIRREAFQNKPIDEAKRSFTFPIVVIESEEGNRGLLNPKDDGGKLAYNVYWYTITENQWEKTWKEVFNSLEEEDAPTSIGGGVFQMTYGKLDEKGNAPQMRDAFRDFTVVYRAKLTAALKNVNEEDFAKKFDEMTEEWTPAKSMSTVIANTFPDPVALKESMATLVTDMETRISLFKNGGGGSANAGITSASDLAGVSAGAGEGTSNLGLLQSGATDEG